MGALKSEIKKATLIEVGMRTEELRDSSLGQIAEHKGAWNSLKEMAAKTRQLCALVAPDLEEYREMVQAKENELAEKEEREPNPAPLQDVHLIKFVMTFVERAARQLENQSAAERNKKLIAEGSLQSYNALIDSIKKDVDKTQAQIDNQLRAEESADEEGELQTDTEGDVEYVQSTKRTNRPPGVRPGTSMAQKRKAEAADPQSEEVDKSPDQDIIPVAVDVVEPGVRQVLSHIQNA